MTIVGFNPKHNYDVRLVADDGSQLGIYRLQDAIRKADEQGLDIINISPNAKPPVAKITDYGKFKYKQKQAEKEAKKKQHVVQLKEIKFGVNIDAHDQNVKLNKIKEFIADDCKVKISVIFHGREMVHQNLGLELLESILKQLDGTAQPDGSITTERKELSIIVKPQIKK